MNHHSSPSARALIGLCLGLLTSIVVNCSGDDDDGAAACRSAGSKLRSCDLVSEGETNCDTTPEPGEECRNSCFAKANCDELRAALCGGGSSGALQTCVDQCNLFTCDNGASINVRQVCDGDQDCADGADERNCPTFTCANGDTVPEDARCNGLPQCRDGSDERACPTFTCADGSTVPDTARCNGFSQCRDGSDETGCPTFTCANGEQIPEQGRCNGFPQCTDGSDETGCPPRATITCNGMPVNGPGQGN